MKMGHQRELREFALQGAIQLAHGLRRGHAGGVAQRDDVHPQRGVTLGVAQHAIGRNRAFEGASKCHRDRADHAKSAAGQRGHAGDVFPLVRAAALQVALGMRFAGRYQQADLVGALPLLQIGQRPLHGALIGAGRLVPDAVPSRQRRQHLAGIGKLRHHLRIGIRGCLHPLEAQRRKRVDQFGFDACRNEIRLMLQAIAGKALAQHHIARHGFSPKPNRLTAWARNLFFCTLELPVMPMFSKVSTISR